MKWDIRSANPDPASLKLEYRTPDGNWTPVPVVWNVSGRTTIRLNSPSPVTVRMEVKDSAGNIGNDSCEVSELR